MPEKEMSALIKALQNDNKTIFQTLDKHDDRHRDAEIQIQKLGSAFPASDVEGHRRYHEYLIQNLEERRKMRIVIAEKSISALVWVLIAFLGAAVWKYFLSFLPHP